MTSPSSRHSKSRRSSTDSSMPCDAAIFSLLLRMHVLEDGGKRRVRLRTVGYDDAP
jgi:hypothetical protein